MLPMTIRLSYVRGEVLSLTPKFQLIVDTTGKRILVNIAEVAYIKSADSHSYASPHTYDIAMSCGQHFVVYGPEAQKILEFFGLSTNSLNG